MASSKPAIILLSLILLSSGFAHAMGRTLKAEGKADGDAPAASPAPCGTNAYLSDGKCSEWRVSGGGGE